MPEPLEPSLWDIQHTIERNHVDTRDDILELKQQMTRQQELLDVRLNNYLLKAVYDAESKAQNDRIAKLETEVTSARARAITAIYAAVGAAASAIIAGVVLAMILGGGH